MKDRPTEYTQNYLTNMRRQALNKYFLSVVQNIEEQFRRDGFLTKDQVSTLLCCSRFSNGKCSQAELNSWMANYQALQG